MSVLCHQTMASLARGVCHPGIRPLVQPLLPQLAEQLAPRQRFFTTTSSLRRYASPPSSKASRAPVSSRPPPPQQQQRASPSAKPSTSTLKSKTSTTTRTTPTTTVAAAAGPSTYASVKALAAKSSPTIVYEGPSHFWFYFGCWSSGVCILTWTTLTGPGVIFNQPEEIPQWVNYVSGASYVLLSAMGFILISKTAGIVSSIRVLPPRARAAVSAAATKPSSSSSTAAAAMAASPAQATAAASSSSSPAAADLQMEVTVRRMLPLLKPKVITTPLDKVSLRSRFSLPNEYVPELKRQREEEARLRALKEYDDNHRMTIPLRHLGIGFKRMFNGVRSAWTDMGFGRIVVNGKEYKVDVTQGYAHDGFRTLERVVGVTPK